MTSSTTEENTYPKPPYDDCEEVWHIFETPIHSKCAYRAMERDGRIFKSITHKVNGLQYIYWHPDKNGIEIWHKKDNVGAWANAIRYLDERFIYACLRSKMDETEENSDDEVRTTSLSEDSEYDIVSNTMDTQTGDGENMDTDTTESNNQVQWAVAKLNTFKSSAKYRILFDIPDFTGFAPTWQLSPALIGAMDGVLATYHLTTGETVLYDKRSCGLIWIRRDCSSYEIRTNNHYALEYAQHFILHQLFTIVTTWQLAPNTIPANSTLWANIYTNIQAQQKHHKRQYKKKTKHRNHFQARKNKKRQMTRTNNES